MMKNYITALLFVLFTSAISANNAQQITVVNWHETNRATTVSFIEKGIEFHVFLNGRFNFEAINNRVVYYDYNGRRVRKYTSPLRIYKNRYNRITRVNNIRIFYDYRGNVSKIGSIVLQYHYNQLIRVGALNITYPYGRPTFYGHVRPNYIDFNLAIRSGTIFGYDNPLFYQSNFRKHYRKYKTDRNYYYYRSAAKNGKRTLIKRRKEIRNNHKIKTHKRNAAVKKREIVKRKSTKTHGRRS